MSFFPAWPFPEKHLQAAQGNLLERALAPQLGLVKEGSQGHHLLCGLELLYACLGLTCTICTMELCAG